MPTPTPRQVAVCLCISTSSLADEPSFLLVSSRKHKDRWVFPKGGMEEDESAAQAAGREAWEEAGLIVGQALHLDHLVELPDEQPHKKSPSLTSSDPSFISSTTYSFELFSLTGSEAGLASEWPEKAERERKWVKGWEELLEAVSWGRREEVMREAVGLARARLSS